MAVSPTGDAAQADAAQPADSAAPMGCEAPRPLFGASARPLEYIDVATVPGGFVVAASASDRQVYVRAFDAEFNAVGDELALRTERATSALDQPVLSLRFEGATGALTYDASLFELSVDRALRVTVVQTAVAQDNGSRSSLLGAWPQTATRPRWTAISRDASLWDLRGASLALASRADSVTPLSGSPSLALADDGSGEYVAIETILQRAENNRVDARSFIVGHGSLIQVRNEPQVGTSVSRAVRIGDELVRIHRQSVANGAQRVSLVRHDARRGTIVSSQQLMESALSTSGAIAITNASAPLSDALLVWTRMNGDPTNQALVAQWGPLGTPTQLDTVGERAMIHGATMDADSQRGWVLWGSYAGAAGMSEARFFVRCVRR